jgi:hypothetical protein
MSELKKKADDPLGPKGQHLLNIGQAIITALHLLAHRLLGNLDQLQT